MPPFTPENFILKSIECHTHPAEAAATIISSFAILFAEFRAWTFSETNH